MNKRMIFYILGKMMGVEGIVLLIPAFVSLLYQEKSGFSFLIVSAVLILIYFVLGRKEPKSKRIYSKEGFAIVGLAWLLWSAFGALPFVLSGSIPHYIDAFFETVSGFTTTGSTILTEIEILPKGIAFWRSFTHWIGGMGVLVFVMMITSLDDDNAMPLMRAEVPGPEADKLVPKARRTAKILYGMYFALTVVETVFLMAGGMSFYDALLRVRGVPTIGKAADKIEKFTEQIKTFRSRLSALSIPELIEAILEETGYKKDLEAEGEIEGETRLQNVEELVNKATGYMSTAEEPTLDGFLEEVALVADVDSLDESENRIVLMTLHGAKGLEFPYVYLSGMEDGLFPSSMSIFSDDKDAIEEERRLCYVGITRAEKELTLTAARQRMVNGETRFAKVSRFIEEIPPQLLDEEEQPIVFERAAGMSRGRRGFEDSGTSGWTTGSFGVSGAGDGDRVRIGGMSGKHSLSENDAAWERGAARMSGWGGVNGSGSAGSGRTLDPYKSAYSSSSRPASPAVIWQGIYGPEGRPSFLRRGRPSPPPQIWRGNGAEDRGRRQGF